MLAARPAAKQAAAGTCRDMPRQQAPRQARHLRAGPTQHVSRVASRQTAPDTPCSAGKTHRRLILCLTDGAWMASVFNGQPAIKLEQRLSIDAGQGLFSSPSLGVSRVAMSGQVGRSEDCPDHLGVVQGWQGLSDDGQLPLSYGSARLEQDVHASHLHEQHSVTL